MRIFTEQEIRRYVSLTPDVVSLVDGAFTAIADGRVQTPPIMRVDVPEHSGEVDVKTAYISGRDNFAIKISSGFFNNHQLGLPSGSGMMTLINCATGRPIAVLLDNGYLTDVRTAAAGAVAGKHLSRRNVDVVGIVGTGMQARYQAQAMKLVRNYKTLMVYGRNRDRVDSFVKDIQPVLDVSVTATSAEQLIRQSDVVVTTTPATTPIVHHDWVRRGLHVTAIGSDAEHKQELDARVLEAADLVICDLKSQCERLGELHHAIAQGIVDGTEDSIVELGEVTSGRHPGRTSDDQITICDLTGTGVQDTAIAEYAFFRLMEHGCGLQID